MEVARGDGGDGGGGGFGGGFGGGARLRFLEEVKEVRLSPEGASELHDLRTGRPVPDLDSVELPPGGVWAWSTNWRVVRTAGCDLEGWRGDAKNPAVQTRLWTRARVKNCPATGRGDDKVSAATGQAAMRHAPESMEEVQARATVDLEALGHSEAEVQRLTAVLGSKEDSMQLRGALNRHMEDVRDAGQRLCALLASFERLEQGLKGKPGEVQARARRAKLRKEVANERQRADATVRAAAARLRTARLPPVSGQPPAANPALCAEGASKPDSGAYVTRAQRDALMASEMQALQGTMGVNDLILREREGEFLGINKDLHHVQGMMTEVASMVQTQGEDLRKIEGNATCALSSTKRGLEQVRKAEAVQGGESSCVIA